MKGAMWIDKEKIQTSEGLGNCTVCFCESYCVLLAQVPLAFKMFLAVMLVSMRFTMWDVEQQEWRRIEGGGIVQDPVGEAYRDNPP